MKIISALLICVLSFSGCQPSDEKLIKNAIKQGVEDEFKNTVKVEKLQTEIKSTDPNGILVAFLVKIRTTEDFYDIAEANPQSQQFWLDYAASMKAITPRTEAFYSFGKITDESFDTVFLTPTLKSGARFEIEGGALIESKFGKFELQEIAFRDASEINGKPAIELADGKNFVIEGDRNYKKERERESEFYKEMSSKLKKVADEVLAEKESVEQAKKAEQERIEREKEEQARIAREKEEQALQEAQKRVSDFENLIISTLKQNWTGEWTSQDARQPVGFNFTRVEKMPSGEITVDGFAFVPQNPNIRKEFIGNVVYDSNELSNVKVKLRSSVGRGTFLELNSTNLGDANREVKERGIFDTSIALCSSDIGWDANFTLLTGHDVSLYGNVGIEYPKRFEPFSARSIAFNMRPAGVNLEVQAPSQNVQPSVMSQKKAVGVLSQLVNQNNRQPIETLTFQEVLDMSNNEGLNPAIAQRIENERTKASNLAQLAVQAASENRITDLQQILVQMEKEFPAAPQTLVWKYAISKAMGDETMANTIFGILDNYPLTEEEKNEILSIHNDGN